MLAGRRALGLDNAVALGLFERALALAPAGHHDRPTVLERYGDAMYHDGRYGDAVAAWEEAVRLFRQDGRIPEAADVMGQMSGRCTNTWATRGIRMLMREAVALLEPIGPDAAARSRPSSRSERWTGHHRHAVRAGPRRPRRARSSRSGLRICGQRDAHLFRGKATAWRGIARAMQGDRAGADEVEEAIATRVAAGDGQSAMSFRINLSIVRSDFVGASNEIGFMEDTLAFGRARGLRADLAWLEMGILQARVEVGDLDRVVDEFPDLDDRLGQMGASAVQLDLRATKLGVDILRGHDPGAEFLEWVERTARHTEAAESLSAGLGTVGAARLMLGDASAARRLVAELVAFEDVGSSWWFALLPMLVRSAIRMDDLDLAAAIHRKVEPQIPSHEHGAAAAAAALLEARGELEAAAEAYADAVRRWEALGVIPELAFALLGHGRTLVALGRLADGRPALERAATIFAGLRAAPALLEIEAMMPSLNVGSAGGATP